MTDLYTNLFIRPFVINNVVYSMQKYILLYEKNKKVKNYKYVDKKKNTKKQSENMSTLFSMDRTINHSNY